ncbi:MAG: NADH-quinone oxidoreductase subunit N [Buchnera aphidicola (Nurudea yanoniella)]
MMITSEQLIVLCPFLILLLTVITIILLISYYRNHFSIFLCSIIGLVFTLLFLYIVQKNIPIDITILFHIDKYSFLYILVVIVSSIISCIFSYFALKNSHYNKEEFYLLLVLSTIGCISLIISNHMFSLFIGMELIFLPTLGLISYTYYKKRSLEAALKYMILSCSISVLALFGIALVYSITGSLTFSSVIYECVVSSLSPNYIFLCGLGLIILSFFFKLSVFPFHIWISDVYEGTEPTVLMYFSTAVKIAVFSVFFKIFIFLTFFNVKFFHIVFEVISCCSIIFGSFMALFQTNIKRFLGYSSISQFGYLLILLLSSKNFDFSLEAVGIYLISYFLSSIGIFGLISVLSNLNYTWKCDFIKFYHGLFWKNSVLSTILSIFLFSFSGIPITIGFIGKFYILSLIIRENLWLLGIMFLIGSILGIYSYLSIVTKFYLYPQVFSKEDKIVLDIYSKNCILFLLAISLLILVLGIYPNLIIGIMSTYKPILFVNL